MKMRKNIVAGNWKMNNDLAETQELLSHLKMQLVKEPKAEVYVASSYVSLYNAFQSLKDPIKVAAQNMHFARKWCLHRRSFSKNVGRDRGENGYFRS